MSLLEDLARGHRSLSSHPTHVVLSEMYILALAADCCTAHWDGVTARASRESGNGLYSGNGPDRAVPPPLENALVSRLLDAFKGLLDPISEDFALPAHTILHCTPVTASQTGNASRVKDDPLAHESGMSEMDDSTGHPAIAEYHVKTLVEYLTASSWTPAFDYFKTVIYSIRTAPAAQHGSAQFDGSSEKDRASLTALRLVSFFWVNGQKLGLVVQEICSSFLHFRRPFQATVAAVIPLLVSNWIDRYPYEFVQLHTHHRRLDGGADTLFDMAHAMGDNGNRRGLFFALQTSLLFLLPDIFEVASNLREAKSNSLAKKAAFLDNLRKALRHGNETAVYCLVSLLRAARHLNAEDDVAIVSFALDIQDELRDAVFSRSSSSSGGPLLEQDLLTAAFVSLAQLNLDSCIVSLLDVCLGSSVPRSFKAAVVQGCGYLARQSNSHEYGTLFSSAVPFMFKQLKV